MEKMDKMASFKNQHNRPSFSSSSSSSSNSNNNNNNNNNNNKFSILLKYQNNK